MEDKEKTVRFVIGAACITFILFCLTVRSCEFRKQCAKHVKAHMPDICK